MVQWLLTITLALLSFNLHAEEQAQEPTKWYTVELILFEQPASHRSDAEVWQPHSIASQIEQSTYLSPYLPPVEVAFRDLEPEAGFNRLPDQSTQLQPLPLMPKTQTAPLSENESPQPYTPAPFSIAAEELWQLTPLKIKLKRSKYYTPLLHTTWVQPGLSSEESQAIYVSSAELLSQSSDEISTLDLVLDQVTLQQNPYSLTANKNEELAPAPITPPKLEGTVRVRLSRYLHVDVDLIYREISKTVTELQDDPYQLGVASKTAQDFANSSEPLSTPLQITSAIAPLYRSEIKVQPTFKSYPMQESRRMRSRHLHYLDHPYVGMLIQITPYEFSTQKENAVNE
jgi:hypothetical protein